MKKFTIEFSRQALKTFEKICGRDKTLAQKIAAAIDTLATDPRRGIPLIGKLKGLFRLRVGSYRVIYIIHHQKLIIYIIELGHRKDVYK
jgi:mRNA interferase RelE/StbE